MTSDVVLDEDIKGIKLLDGKLYYISADDKIKSVDLALQILAIKNYLMYFSDC